MINVGSFKFNKNASAWEIGLRKRFLFIAIIIIVVLTTIVAIILYSKFNTALVPCGTPATLYTFNISILNPGVVSIPWIIGGVDNVSQGTILQVNLTFTSTTNQQIIIPIENIELTHYNNTVDYNHWTSTNTNYSDIQRNAFNYSFNVNPIIIEPEKSNSTILTIDLAKDAPLGQYTLTTHLGNVRMLNEDGSYDLSYRETIGLYIIVTSKVD